ncbi:MAG: 2'-5' RNA ligase family protein [Vicinamibacterales bacterium]
MGATMAVHFLLLELTDPVVNAFLWRVRHILTGHYGKGPIHVTLRGPYEGDSPRKVLEDARAKLKYDVLRIAGVGRFSNPGEEVVFFRVDSPHLREVWWKKSFPIERYGFEPHVSVYRGHDADFADEAAAILREEHVELMCAEHRLVWYKTKQPDLFTPSSPSVGAMVGLEQSGRTAILDRVERRVDSYRARQMASRP